jgi:hypothetical protein
MTRIFSKNSHFFVPVSQFLSNGSCHENLTGDQIFANTIFQKKCVTPNNFPHDTSKTRSIGILKECPKTHFLDRFPLAFWGPEPKKRYRDSEALFFRQKPGKSRFRIPIDFDLEGICRKLIAEKYLMPRFLKPVFGKRTQKVGF